MEQKGATPQITIVREAPGGILARSIRQLPTPPRLGVLGGTFNPVTSAHLVLAQRASDKFKLDEVIFVLPQTPPHKDIREVSIADRLRMLELALAPYDSFSVGLCTHGLFMEIYRALAKVYPEATRVYFVAGRDAAERALTWRYPDPEEALAEMFARFELIVAERDGPFLLPADPRLAPHRDKIHLLEMPADYQPLSATLVRERLKKGEPIAGLVPEPVKAYIAEKRLYVTEAERQGSIESSDPQVEAIAIAIFQGEDASKVLIVKRPDEDAELPGIWGLPAGALRANETAEDAVGRVGKEKLGVELEDIRLLAEGQQDRGNYRLRMKLYRAKISPKTRPELPSAASRTHQTTYYTAWAWGQIESLQDGARRGSLCCQLLLNYLADRRA